VNLRDFQEEGIIPSTVNDGIIDLQYQGEAGALIAELSSVDENGSFVSPVPLTCNGQRLAEMAAWRTDGDWHSSLSIWNVAKEQMEVEIRISYPGGEYQLQKSIAPGATAMVSINELQQTQEPDSAGRRIPQDVISGGVSISSSNRVSGLVLNSMMVNPVTKTCAECGSYGYVRKCVLTDDINSTASIKYTIHRAVGESFGMYIVLTWSTGLPEVVDAVIISNTNPSVASVSGMSTVTTLSPGLTTLTGLTFYEYPLDRFCSVYGRLETAGDLQALRITFQKSDGTSLPSPFRVGISATTLGGVVHNRTQQVRVVVEPSSQAANVTVQVSNKLQLSNLNTSGGVITFGVVGVTKSDDPGDASIQVKRSGNTLSTAPVSIVVPAKVATPHDTQGGGVIIENRVLDASTSPAIIGLPSGQVQLSTIYVRILSITVRDQFDALIGDIYPGAEVSELSGGSYHSINQSLTTSSTYSDPVGVSLASSVVAAGSSAANSWPTQAKIPAPAGCFPDTQNIAVRVDGFNLNPAIANRMVEICGNGSSTTSPPVSLTITWP
jgi:hypothetical protein